MSAAPSPGATVAPIADNAHEFGALNSLGLCAVLGMCVFAGYHLKQRKFYYLPESAATMLIGALAGGLVELFYPSEDELSFIRFEPQLFFFVLLPPIIFEAGYKLNKKGFFSNFTTIMLYAVLGTLVSTFVIGFLLYGFAELGVIALEGHTPIEALLFGALISAVDPVATLSIMGAKELNCDPLLYSLVFGESVLNDAVAIVLFKTIQGFAGPNAAQTTFDAGTLFSVVGQFVGVSLGSIVIGVGCGLLCCLLMKCSDLKKYHNYEIVILFLTAFGSFALSESIEWQGGGLSGIMSLFFCGITLSHYNYFNLSEASQVSSSYVFETMAYISETIVFAYIGTSIFSRKHSWDIGLIALSILFCALARALNTFPFSACANIKRKKKVPWKMQIVIWFAGLRGAIAFALAMSLNEVTESPNKNFIVTTTLFIVIFTTLVCGGLTEPLLRKMGMQRTSNRHRAPSGPDSLSQSMLGPSYMLTAGGGRNASQPQTVRGGKKSGGMHGWWRGFDQKFMKPIFGGADPELHRRRGRNAVGFGGSDVNIGSSGDFEVSFTGGGEDGLGGSDSLGAGKVGAELGEESESLVAEAIKEADGVSTTSGGVDASESDIF